MTSSSKIVQTLCCIFLQPEKSKPMYISYVCLCRISVFMQIVGKAWQCNGNWTDAVRYSMACVFHDAEF